MYGKRKYQRELMAARRNAKNPRPQYIPSWEDIHTRNRLQRYLDTRPVSGYNY